MEVYSISVLIGEKIYHGQIKPMETVTVGSGKKNTIHVSEITESLIKIYNNHNGFYCSVKYPYNISKKDLIPGELTVIDSEKRIGIVPSLYEEEPQESFTLPYNGIIKIGSSDNNNIIIKNRYVSKNHMVIRMESGIARFEDKKSTNGTYLNGKITSSGKLKSGDVLSVIGIRIIYENNMLLFEGTKDSLNIVYDNTVSFDKNVHGRKESGKMPVFKRSPRMMSQLPKEEIVLANPPSKGQRFEKHGGVFASLLGSGSMFVASMAMGAASPAFLAARAASLVSPIASAGTQSSSNKKRKKQLEKYEEKRRLKYGKYLQDEKARIEAVAKEQRDIITKENPSPQDCLSMVSDINRRLFERTMSDRDFLDVRLGMGYEELCVPVKSFTSGHEFYMDNDEVKDLLEELVEETKYVDYVPFRLPLNQFHSVGVIGERAKVTALVRNLIVALTAVHFYRDVKIIGIFDENEREIWEPIRWLPHIWDDNKDCRFLAFTDSEKSALCEQINSILEVRKRNASEHSYGLKTQQHPYYIFIAGSKRHLKDEVIMKNLMLNSEDMGISTLFLFDDLVSVPHGCQYIIDLTEDCLAYETDKNNLRAYFTMDQNVPVQDFDQFARRMSAIKVEGFSEDAGIPDSLTFLQGYDVKRVEELDIVSRWRKNKSYKSLAVPIGQMRGGKTFSLDVAETAIGGHGVHGLVAGITGSGKSELLISWILSMAVNYHPHDVNFVLIDYKGGGMANILDRLPHVVGKITNIDSNINRSLVSLESEINRRMSVFAHYSDKTGIVINNINQYQRLYQEGQIDKPMSHLILVADEFAELKKNEPEFMSGLMSASRVGRTLGIHLMLATQKPSGVVDDQIWSNTGFRLCLKVASAQDSREMLKNPDAAGINRPGRLYVQVGENEIYELVQSYYSAAPYVPDKAAIQDGGNQLKLVLTSGNRVSPVPKKKVQAEMDEVTAICDAIIRTTEEQGITPLEGPWKPELPEYISLETLLGGTGYRKGTWNSKYEWLKIPVGLYDDPFTQSQGTEVIDFIESGHLGIYGAPSTGKTMLMKTIMLSAAMNYTPQDVQMYVLDCGGWTTSEFVHLPHMGGIALDCENEKVEKLEKLLWDELEYRKSLLLKSHVSSLEAYRESVSKDIPAIFFFIDNFPAVFELYPDMENLFITLSGQGAAYGIFLIYTSNSTTGIRFKVMQNIKNAIAFEMTDRGDYVSLVGRLEGATPSKIQGRALKKASPPIEIHAAVYMDGETETVRSANLRELMLEMSSSWDGSLPKPIPVMPDTVTGEEIARSYSIRNRIPIGISYDTIQPCFVDMSERYNLVIAGEQGSGKSQMMKDIFFMIKEKNPTDIFYVFDSTSNSLEELKKEATDYTTDNDPSAVKRILDTVVDTLNQRVRNKQKQSKKNPEEFDEKSYRNSLQQICIFIDDLKEFVDEAENESRDAMARISHLAQGLGVLVFVASRVNELAGYATIETLTLQLLKSQQGIALSGNALSYNMFKENLSYSEKSKELKETEGYYFNQGICTKFRRRDS